jgi:NADH-quinone oxidoreductase subunit B
VDDSRVIPITPVPGAGPARPKSAAFEYIATRKDELVGWARKFSIFPYPFVTACCAMEFMAVSSTPYDTDRFGAALPRFSPRQADLLMVVGTVTHKQAPILLKVYEQMCEPKWVVAFGVCATSGGFYQNYAALPGIDRIIPVDLYIPGCPPRPEMVIDGIMKLQDRIARDRHPRVAGTARKRCGPERLPWWTGRFDEDPLTGLSEAEASTMIVGGFIEPLVKELPMEYAVEMNKLIQLQMEGSVG